MYARYSLICRSYVDLSYVDHMLIGRSYGIQEIDPNKLKVLFLIYSVLPTQLGTRATEINHISYPHGL